MILHFDIIPHKRQRYDTVGDYYKWGRNSWYFAISKMKDKRYVWLVFFHEVIEWGMCRLMGVKQRDIDRFDIGYEKARATRQAAIDVGYSKEEAIIYPPCGCKFQDEPGDDMHAPYHEPHVVASQCERIIAKALGVDMIAYDEAVMRL